ncbi:MAG: sodium-dependent bicarbonate transport family permease [Planctomycetes bacterium]|nr:sodium-dependent bicarbonate transport family permease [Planctomycetota bacterium]
MDLGLIAGNLLTPPVLFFALGMAATLLRSDLEIPQAVTRGLSLYLLFAIGMHGGVELAAAGFAADALLPLAAGVVASALVPAIVFGLLKKRFGAADAAAIGATYGSISAVTFITACSFLDDRGTAWSGTMVAAMALMESPAILVGVLLARRAGVRASDDGGDGDGPREGHGSLLREAFLNGPVFLLLGSLVIGMLTGEKGWKAVAPFAYEPFKGVLCLFLLDMGLIAARRLRALRESGAFLIGFSLIVPLVNASLAIGVARLLDFAPGDALLFTVLCASASYIAVPAAIRLTLPQANPSLFLPMSLAMTFPFNVTLGIPLYMTAIDLLWRTA